MPSGLSHPSKLDQFITKIRDVLVYLFLYLEYFLQIFLQASSTDPDETPHHVA